MITLKLWQAIVAVVVIVGVSILIARKTRPAVSTSELENKIKIKENEVDSLLDVNDSLKTVSEQHFYLYRQSENKSTSIEKEYIKIKLKLYALPEIKTTSDAVRDSLWRSLYPGW